MAGVIAVAQLCTACLTGWLMAGVIAVAQLCTACLTGWPSWLESVLLVGPHMCIIASFPGHPLVLSTLYPKKVKQVEGLV